MATTKKEETAAGGAVVEQKNTSVATINFENDAGAGQEGADSKSFAIPFISLLQGLSPQIETVEGARPGKFINTITNELFDSMSLIPCAFQRRFVRWTPRSTGGGYKGELSPIDVETGNVPGMSIHQGVYLMDVPAGVTTVFDKDGKPLFDHLADTRNHFVLYQTPTGTWQRALISLAGTQIKKSKRWMGRIQSIEMTNAAGKIFNPASYSHVYSAKPAKETNAKGSWWGYDINMAFPVADPAIYALAKMFHNDIVAGNIEVAQPVNDADVAAGGDNEKF
jgi:hypothetical protein